MGNVLIIGGTTFDSVIHLDKLPDPVPQTIHYAAYTETLGSTGAGKALNLSKLKVPATLHSIIGNDEYGVKIRKKLDEVGVDFVYDHDPRGTERHVNLMSPQGDRISIFVTQSSSELHLNLHRIEQLIKEADLVVLNIIAYTKQLIPLLKQYKKTVWTDLHDYNPGNPYHDDFIEIADFIFVSSDNMPDYKPMMEKWISLGKQLVVCTHGKNGATALTNNQEWLETPIINEYRYKDANGAGDSFFSGFLYGFLRGKSTEESLKLGTVCAGLCITSKELAYEELNPRLLEEEYEKFFG
ncbi:carbohydrate kinase family protein [Mesobacillus selenatarsenatis]|uniref:carbohydrate kinase family protein n=1 Tax=Mesobacillus selenatarsenatis TaxID=388741 RepID=UPI0005A66449|nr:carbohydrate kinase family protein [Mesobacillus selenatarsenatis]